MRVKANAPQFCTFYLAKVREKVQLWLNAGVGTVWVVEPTSKEVTVYRRGETTTVFSAESEITGGDSLPGFSCKVALFFPE